MRPVDILMVEDSSVVSLPPPSVKHVRQKSMRTSPGGKESPPPGGA